MSCGVGDGGSSATLMRSNIDETGRRVSRYMLCIHPAVDAMSLGNLVRTVVDTF